MPDNKDQELAAVLTALHHKAEELLIANDIYDINNYGWIDHDTPDPDFFGHMIWQTQPPFQCDWGAFLNGAKATFFPTDRDEALVLAGEDFVGTMAFARRAFGLAFCYAQGADTNIVGGEEMESYWREYATTSHWLNVASDRVRDYFVVAQFGTSVQDYHRAYRLRSGNRKPSTVCLFKKQQKENRGGMPKAWEN